MAEREVEVPRYQVDRGLVSHHSETAFPGVDLAAGYGIADRDPQQTKIAGLLACGAEVNLVVRIWYVGLRK